MNPSPITHTAVYGIVFTLLAGCQKDNTAVQPQQQFSSEALVEKRRANTEVTPPELRTQKSVKATSEKKSKHGRTDAMIIEIIPNRAIGEFRIGMNRKELSKEARATIENDVGLFQGVNFVLNGDVVEDVWIDDLRKFRHDIRFRERLVSRNASIDDLKTLFGPCSRDRTGRGGIYYNCGGGVVLGFDIEESEKYVQIRLKNRLTL